MSKKTLLAIGLAAITSCAAGASFHKGFSIGANVGITDMDGKLNRSFTAIPAADNSNLGARGPVAGLFLGYGWSPHIGGIHIGGEAFGQFENSNAKREDLIGAGGLATNFSTSLKATNTFGAALKFGFGCKEALFYAKVGFASTKFKYNFNVVSPGVPFSATTSPRKGGLLLGVGMDYAFVKNWTIGGEYLYTTYGSIKLNIPNTVTSTHSYKPKTSTFNVRLRYIF